MTIKKQKPIVSNTAKELAEAMELDPADIVEWELRYSLTKRIREATKRSKMTVSAIARDSGTSRARITKVLQGNSRGISVDVLLRVLGAVGETIRISYRKLQERSGSTAHSASVSI